MVEIISHKIYKNKIIHCNTNTNLYGFIRLAHMITEAEKFHNGHLQAGESVKAVPWLSPNSLKPQREGSQ
jgi:hypothetical protein